MKSEVRRNVKLQTHVSEEMAEYVRSYAEGYDVTVSNVIRWASGSHEQKQVTDRAHNADTPRKNDQSMNEPLTLQRSHRTLIIRADKYDLSPVCSIECCNQLEARQMEEWLDRCTIRLAGWVEMELLERKEAYE